VVPLQVQLPAQALQLLLQGLPALLGLLPGRLGLLQGGSHLLGGLLEGAELLAALGEGCPQRVLLGPETAELEGVLPGCHQLLLESPDLLPQGEVL
jgi:hypothetical protein